MSSDPKRLLDGAGSELERLLLASALSARPKPWARVRAAVLFLFAALGAMTFVKAALATVAKVPAGVLRWTGIGVSTSALVITGVKVIDRAAAPAPAEVSAPAASPVRVASSARLAPATPPEPAVVSQAVEPSVPSRATKTTPAATVKARSVALTRELEILDRASRALNSGRAQQALKELEVHRRTIPRKVMAEEALRLRVEATLASGDAVSARRLSQEFSRRYPNSPYAQRLRSLLP